MPNMRAEMAKRKQASSSEARLQEELTLLYEELRPEQAVFIAREVIKHARASGNSMLCMLIADGLNACGDEREARRKRKGNRQQRTTKSRG